MPTQNTVAEDRSGWLPSPVSAWAGGPPWLGSKMAHAVKWSAMLVALFWMLVFRLSQSVERLPEFVYVNF